MKKLSWGFKKFLNFSVLFIATLALILNISNSQLVLADEATPSAEQSTSTESVQTPEQTTPVSDTTDISTNTSTIAVSSSTDVSPDTSTTATNTSTPLLNTSASTNEEATQSATPVTTSEASSSAIPTTNSSGSSLPAGTLELNRTYSTPENSNVRIKFTSLPNSINNFTFNMSTLSAQQILRLGALDSNAYEITSNMPNGSFTYDLTLPYPAGVTGTNFKVFYASDINGLSNPNQITQSITDNGDGTFTIHNLDHFTVFVVVNPNSQANCDAITIGTTPGSTCYTTVQAAVNAAVNGDTINIGNTGSPYNETVYVNKQLTINGVGNPSVTAFVLQITPVTITGITTSVSIATPTVSLTNPVNNGNQTTATISGNGAGNATVNYTITGTSGSVTGTGTISATGVINISVNVSTLGEGALTLTVYLSSGSYTSSNATANAFKDTTGPASATGLTITNPINIGNNTSISFSGNGEAGTTVNWTLSNGASTQTGTTTVSASGTFSVTGRDVSSFPDGTITLSITLTDSSGNVSSSSSTTATKDTVAPTLTTVTISSNNANSSFAKVGDVVTLNFTSSETINTPTVTIAGNAATVSNLGGNNWRAIYTMTSSDTQGSIGFSISFSDIAGNSGTIVNATTNSSAVTFDKTNPTIATSITTSNANPNYAKVGDTITLTLIGDETLQTPIVTIAGNSVAPVNTTGNTWVATYVMTSFDTQGLIAYTINYSDLASNAGTPVNTNSAITFDRSNPTLLSHSLISSNSNGNFARVGDTVTLNFTASESIQTPTVTIAGNTVIANNIGGNNWRATYVMAGTDTEGLIPYTIAFSDLASNAGTSINTNSTVTFDRTNPSLTSTTVTSSNSNGSYAKVGDTITINFTSSENIQTPVVTISEQTATVVNVGGNNWRATYVMTGTDTEGLIAYTINFQDLASNAGTPVNTNTGITFDRTNPTLTSTTITTSNANPNYARSGDTITVNFTSSESIQTPTVTISGQTATVVNTGGNNWRATYTMASSDTEGLIAYTISYQDLASNQGTPVNTNSAITFDRTNPAAPVVSLTNPVNLSNQTFVSITGTGEANATFAWSITDGTTSITNTGTVTASGVISVTGIDVTTLSDGTLTLSITLTDAAGNNSTAGSTTATKDTVAPTLTSTTVASSNANPNYARVGDTITLNFTSSEAINNPVVTIATNSVTASNIGGNNWRATYVMTSSDTEGFIPYSIAFSDLANNNGTTVNANSTIVFDRTSPTLTATTVTTSNANPNYAKNADTITVNFTSSESIQTPIVTISGNTLTANNTGGNNWTASYVMAGTDTEGLIAYTISYQDLASNSGTPVNTNSTITFDRTFPLAPVVSMTNPVNGSNVTTVSILGTGEANITFSWSITDGTLSVTNTGTVTAGGAISVTNIDVSGLADGTLTLSVFLTDAASNVGSSGTNTATKDVVAPTLTSTTITSSNSNGNYAKVGDVITLDFTSSETIQIPTVTIAGQTATVVNIGGNNWRATYTMTSTDTEGLIAYTIAFSDTAGNPGTTVNATSTIVFDRSNPTLSGVTATSSNANSSYAKSGDIITVNFISSETIQTPVVIIAGQNATVTNPSGNNWTATYTMAGADTEELIAYTISYQDLASNAGTPVNTNSTITFDKTFPTATWTAPAANSTVSGNVTLTASASDINGVVSVTFAYQRNDGVDTFHTVATVTSGSFETNWNASGLALDNYTLRITVTDIAGNSINIDKVVALATVINQASVQLSSVTTSGIVVSWSTADPTGSRVIFDTVSHTTLGTAPNYGYSFSTANFDTLIKVLNHLVTLTGLNASTTYYYRTVSSGSPEAVSQEFSFKTSSATQSLSPASATGASAPSCGAGKPGSTPVLLSAKAIGNKIKLIWSKVTSPVTHYSIMYGLGHDKYQFGVANTGNVTEFEIGALQSGVVYYFRIKAGNECNASEFSNELSTTANSNIAYDISSAVVNGIGGLLGVKEAFAADLDLSGAEASSSTMEASVAGSFIESTPSAKIEVKKSASNLLKNILIGSGIVLLVTSGLFYYSTIAKKQ